MECGNYRTICLSSTAYKMYTKIVEERTRKFVKHKFNDKQVAFRRRRKTTVNIFILRNLIEKKNETNEKLFVTFIYFKAAFDTVESIMETNGKDGSPKDANRNSEYSIYKINKQQFMEG